MEKLYYNDPMCFQFTAQVLSCHQEADRWAITLDRTAFYPEGGGQACDLGTLEDVSVLDVREREEAVVHYCAAPLELGQTVTGVVDAQRRLDLMQQHTGEHILSGIVCRRYGWHNVGFHVGETLMQIDFDGPIPQEDLESLELEANRAVWENLPVRCWYPSREELPSVPYRTKKALPWPVRIVEVPGYDLCACCGTHLPYTGQIGMIKILSCMKFHQGVRLELVCGKRAFTYLSRIYEQNRLVSQAFSAKPLETGDAAQRMCNQLAAEKLRSASLEKQVFDSIAESYVNHTNVLHMGQSLSGNGLRELADRIAGKISGWVAVLSGSDREGWNLCLVSKTQEVKALGSQIAQALNGRGGGKSGIFQGSLKATEAQIRAFFQERI